MATAKRTAPDKRKESVEKSGIKLAVKVGVSNITRRMLAAESGISEALVSHYMGDREAMRKKIARITKAAGKVQPDKEKQLVIGKKLRAHSVQEVIGAKKSSASRPIAGSKRPDTLTVTASPAAPVSDAQVCEHFGVTAARLPKAPPPPPPQHESETIYANAAS